MTAIAEPTDRSQQIEQLRRRIAAVPGRNTERAPDLFEPTVGADHRGARPDAPEPASVPASAHHVLPVMEPMAALLPHRGLARGAVTAVSGASSTLLGFLAAATRSGGWVAVIGLPKLGLLAAHGMGADLSRTAVVPDAGSDPTDAAAIALDGLDLVVLGLGGASIAPTRARGITARARSKNAALIVTDGHWPSVDLTVHTEIAGYTGLGIGHGRIRGIELDVAATARGRAARTGRFTVTAAHGHLDWDVATDHDSSRSDGSHFREAL